MKKYFFKYSYMFIISFVAAIILMEASVLGFDIISNAIDKFLNGETIEFENTLLNLFLFAIIAVICSFVKDYFGNIFGAKVLKDLRESIVRKLVFLEFRYFSEKGSGGAATGLLTDMKELQNLICDIFPEMVFGIVSALIMLIYVFTINKILIIAIAMSYPFVFFAVKIISRKIINLSKKRRELIEKETNAVYDILGGIDVVKSYNLYDTMLLRLESIMNKIFDVEKKRGKITSVMEAARCILKWIPTVICLCVGAELVESNSITTGEFFVFILISERTFEKLSSIPYYINEIADGITSLQRVNLFFNEKEERKDGETSITNTKKLIELKNISFSYDDNYIFENFNFTLNKGEKVAFVGRSGSGKSTIFNIICGLYPIGNGEYNFFGNDFYNTNIDFARSKISLISQDTFLFPATIKENIALETDVNDEEIKKACRLANIYDFIMTLPDKYNTLTGERGVMLSGGERQRISLARAFLKNSEIFLMDEPVSALDSENEKILTEIIKNLDKTVIIIAHRLSIAKECDRICVFDKGKIVQQGNHEELINSEGLYKSLWEKGGSTT